MYQVGHYGVALAAYAPLGAVVSAAGYEVAAIVGGLVCVSLSTLPDCDHRLPFLEHRGLTHTVLFALFVGTGLAAATALLVDPGSAFLRVGFAGFAFVVGTLSVGSHLLADALTPMGIRPFRPVSQRHYALDVTPSKSPVANYALFGAGVSTVLAAVGVVFLLG